MGTMILVSGSNGSGKSVFAEELVSKTRGERYYIATMVSQTEDNRRRIEKHRRQREGLGFTTLEIPCNVAKVPAVPNSVVLLEDVSNLLANAIFTHGWDADAVYRDILGLAAKCRILVMVTISGMQASVYEGETADYITALNELNRRLSEAADAAVIMRNGVPECQKGDLNACI